MKKAQPKDKDERDGKERKYKPKLIKDLKRREVSEPTSFGYYDVILADKKLQYKYATLYAFDQDDFFRQLPPRLKQKVVEKCLEK